MLELSDQLQIHTSTNYDEILTAIGIISTSRNQYIVEYVYQKY